MTNTVDETKGDNGRGAARQTRRFEISMPVASAKVVEAAATLGGYDTTETFIRQAALDAAEEFQQRVQGLFGRDDGRGKGRKASKGDVNEP